MDRHVAASQGAEPSGDGEVVKSGLPTLCAKRMKTAIRVFHFPS